MRDKRIAFFELSGIVAVWAVLLYISVGFATIFETYERGRIYNFKIKKDGR
jgi:hypothetical protein